MALLSLHNIQIRFNGISILDKVNLHIEQGEKVCLIGRNGAGKTTLMKIINGDIRADEGEIRKQQGIKISRLNQELPLDEHGKVFEVVVRSLGKCGELLTAFKNVSAALGTQHADVRKHDRLVKELANIQHEIELHNAWDIELKAEKVISLMNLPPDADFSTLSVGLKRRVLLARALIDEPDLLILDEPTNHLDIDAIKWLEDFLKQYQGTLFFVTHDRVFLKKIATRVVHLDRGALKSYTCDYETFLKRREEELNAEEGNNALFDKKLALEEVWLRKGVKARRTRNEGRVKALLKLREIRANRRTVAGNVKLETQEIIKSGKMVIETRHLTFAYNGHPPVIKNFTTIIGRGDKVGIIGPNGCGKSTLLNLLLDKYKPQAGEVKLGTNLEVAYFDQRRNQLNEDLTLEENVAGKNEKVLFNSRPRHVVGYLQEFLFTSAQIKSLVNTLSGGEKNRLLLAKLFTQPANLLVLDEPTNDLDIETLELLEELLIEYEGNILLVSHDREFLNNVVTDVIVFEGDGKLTRHNGGYDDWQTFVKHQENSHKGKDDGPKEYNNGEKARVNADGSRKLSFKEKKELEELPLQIEQLEEQRRVFHSKMEDPMFYKQAANEIKEVQVQLEKIEKELARLYGRWEFLETPQTK